MSRIGNVARFILHIVFGLIAALVVSAALLILAALYRPEWIFNDRTVLAAASYARTHGVPIEWESIGASVRSESLLVKEFTLGARGFCFRDPAKDEIRACAEKAQITATVDFRSISPRVRIIGPVQIDGGEFEYREPKTAKTDKKTSPPLTLPHWLEGARLHRTHIELRKIAIQLQERAILGKASIHVEGAKGEVDINAQSGVMSLQSKIQAQLEETRIQSSIQATLLHVVPGLERVALDHCSLTLDRLAATRSGIALDCPIDFSVPLPPKEFARFKIPTRAGARIVADLKSESYPPSPQAPVDGRLDVELKPVLAPLLQGGGGVSSQIKGIPSQFPNHWNINADLALKVEVPDFQKVVRELRSTPWAVPAPLQALNGRITLSAHGPMDLKNKVVPLIFSTDLASKSQKFNVNSTGEIKLPFAAGNPLELKLDVLLSDVQLELPRLDLAKPPTFFPDSRIQKTPKKQAPEGNPPKIQIALKTPANQPVRLISNLAREPVPLTLDLHSESGKPIAGSIGIQNFSLKLFRRDARVDHLNLTLVGPSEEMPINGKISFKYTDYTVRMLLLGTAEKPQMILQSDPPLPQEQLMSVLFFGEPLDSLDPERLNSIGNAQAALADGVLNLASIYALASTPIQSIGYDPQKGIATMKVRLAEGTSLNIGAKSSEVQEIGVRKRFGPHWTVTTQVENATGASERTISAFLEWALRY